MSWVRLYNHIIVNDKYLVGWIFINSKGHKTAQMTIKKRKNE